MEARKTLQAALGLLVAASIGFIVLTWADFYANAGPGSGYRVISGYIDDHRVRLVASMALAATMVWGAMGYCVWRSRHVLGAIWDNLKQTVSGRPSGPR